MDISKYEDINRLAHVAAHITKGSTAGKLKQPHTYVLVALHERQYWTNKLPVRLHQCNWKPSRSGGVQTALRVSTNWRSVDTVDHNLDNQNTPDMLG